MLRFIVRNKVHDAHSGCTSEGFYTIDIDTPELEAALRGGGHGSSGYDYHELVGVEILPATKPEGGA